MGQAWVVGDVLKWSGPAATIAQKDVDGELLRLARSFEETLARVRSKRPAYRSRIRCRAGRNFRAHGGMLRELFDSGEFEREIRASLLTAEAAVGRVLQRWYQKLAKLENQTFRQARTMCWIWAALSFAGSVANRRPASSRFPKAAFWLSRSFSLRMW